MVGYFEGIDSERGIAWRASDSLSVRSFPRIALEDNVPDHSTISRTRRLLDLETHQGVFPWVLSVLRAALIDFRDCYNHHWILQRLNYRTPVEARQDYLLDLQAAA